MKRIVSLFLAIMMFSMICVTAFAADPYMYVNTSKLKQRNGPGKNYEVIATYPIGTKVTVIEKGKDWSLVEPCDVKDARVGYMMTSYLSKKAPDPKDMGPTYEDVDAAVRGLKVLAEPYTTVMKTTKPTNYVHLRWIPNTSARYISKHLRDTKIRVLAQSKYWAQVEIVETGAVGFIVRSCVADPEQAVK